MDHDARCEAHDATILVLRERSHELANQLILQTSEHQLASSEIRGDLKLLCERVPVDLKEEFTRVRTRLDAVHTDFVLLRTQVYWVVATMVAAGIVAFMSFVLRGGMKG